MATEKQRDLIDREALGIGRCNPDVFPLENRGYCAGWNGVISLIEQAPTVDAVEVVHGRWIHGHDLLYCSRCGFEIGTSDDYTYCPNCGAKMDGGD